MHFIPGLKQAGHSVQPGMFFDTVTFTPKGEQSEIKKRAEEKKINLNYLKDGRVGLVNLLTNLNSRLKRRNKISWFFFKYSF